MPAQETEQPQVPQPMHLRSEPDPSRISSEQPVRSIYLYCYLQILNALQRPIEQMSAEPVSMRGGGAGDVCCGL